MIRIASIASFICLVVSSVVAMVGILCLSEIATPALVLMVLSAAAHAGIDQYRTWLWKQGR